ISILIDIVGKDVERDGFIPFGVDLIGCGHWRMVGVRRGAGLAAYIVGAVLKAELLDIFERSAQPERGIAADIGDGNGGTAYRDVVICAFAVKAGIIGAGTAVQNNFAPLSPEDIVPIAPIERIGAGTAVESVISSTAEQQIVTGAAADG